jgi:hypothetical protein
MHIDLRSARNFARPLCWLFAVTLLFAAGLGSARAQGLGRISGIVTDATGAAVPSAKVVATDAGTGYAATVTTNAQGEFVFASLPPTVYNLSATAPGFQTFVQNGVSLKADQAVTVNPALQVGAESQTVLVTTESPQVDVVTGTLSQVVEQRQVNELPLNGRNAAQLTLLAPGVLPAPNISSIDQGNTKTFPVVVLITVNGARTNQTNFMLDGGNNVDEYTNVNAPFPFPDALQEFSVQTSNYQAEYGENAGGVVNIITKSGTSNFHGDVFEYVRNRVFNAHDHFSTFNGKPYTDPLKRNQFGGVIGGPVGIPFLWKAKQGFFFAGYQGSRWRDVSATTSNDSSLPSTANEAGLFQFTATGTPTTANCIVDPRINQCFPYTQVGTNLYQATIPTTRFDKASLALLNYIPVAAANGTPFSYLQPNSQNYDEGVGRYDQALTSKDRLTARYYVDKFHLVGVLDPKNYLTYQDQSDITYQTALLSETHTFNEHWLNNLIVNYQREGSVRGPLPGGIDAGTLGVNIWQPAFPSVQSISVSGDFSFGQSPHATFKRSNVTLSDDVHWVKGTHDISFGFHGELARLDVVNTNGQPGQFTFASTTTNNAMASFFLGYLSSFSQSAGQFQDNRAKFIGTYVQDSWKATPRLTFNYGLRWEPFIPQTDAGRMGQFNPTAYATNRVSAIYPLAPVGLLFPGDTGMPRDGVRSNYKNFMPRLGFAWDVFGNSTTSIRGGVGMFYDTRMNDLFNNGWIGSNPFTETYSVSNPSASDPTSTFTNPYGASPNPFPVTLPLPANTPFPAPVTVITFDPSGTFHTPLMYNWNLAVQQQITNTLTSQIAYVGSHGSHIFTNMELNPAIQNGATDTAGNEQARRIYKNFASISESNMGGNTLFNALQGTLTKRISQGLSATLGYTWSKSLDDLPYNTAVTSAGAGQAYILPITVPNFKRLDYGPSVFDHRNNLTLSYTWVFPAWKAAPLMVRAVVNGWQTAGLVSLHSGDPLNIIVGADRSLAGLGTGLDVPIRTGKGYGGSACTFGIPSTSTCANYLDPTAFATPAQDTFGNIKKDSFVGPRYTDWDASLTRSFHIHETTAFQFRAEYFNLLNHTNLGDPNLTQTSASFGRIGSDIAPRIAQLSAKLVF